MKMKFFPKIFQINQMQSIFVNNAENEDILKSTSSLYCRYYKSHRIVTRLKCFVIFPDLDLTKMCKIGLERLVRSCFYICWCDSGGFPNQGNFC